jgi:hypothetical protein
MIEDWQAITTALEDEHADVLPALALTARLRADLDRAERQLIRLARERGASWQEIAASLGLRSRQAAEQRWLRLCGASGRDVTETRRQRSVDKITGEQVLALRAAVTALSDQVDNPLARKTLEVARTATPGALYDLAKLAVNDLSGAPSTPALERVRELIRRVDSDRRNL